MFPELSGSEAHTPQLMVIPRSLDIRKTCDTSFHAVQNLFRSGYADNRVEPPFGISIRELGKYSGAGCYPDRTEGVFQFRECVERCSKIIRPSIQLLLDLVMLLCADHTGWGIQLRIPSIRIHVHVRSGFKDGSIYDCTPDWNGFRERVWHAFACSRRIHQEQSCVGTNQRQYV